MLTYATSKAKSGTTPTIRKTNENDVAMLLGLVASYCADIGANNPLPLLARIESGDSRIFVTDNMSGASGYFRIGDDAIGELLFVIKERRKTALAYRLFSKAMLEAKKEGCRRMLVAVPPIREALYMKRGFSKNNHLILNKGMATLEYWL